MVASQIHKTLETEFGKDYAFNNEVGAYLTKYFYSTGEYYNWNDRLKHGTGSELDVKAYIDFYQIK
jgi:Zn-dependent M32 family carboxypeptidase